MGSISTGQIRVFSSQIEFLAQQADLLSDIKIAWIYEGSGFLRVDGQNESLGRNSLVTIPAHVPVNFIEEKNWPLRLSLLSFDPTLISEDTQAICNHLWKKLKAPQVEALANVFRIRMIEESFDSLFAEETDQLAFHQEGMELYLTQLLLFLARSPEQKVKADSTLRSQAAMNACLEFIDSNFRKPLNNEYLADYVGYTPRHLNNLFKREVKVTVRQYIISRRIDYAKRRLKETSNINHVAADSGFNDITHFYRTFKNMVGIAPQQYIQSEVA